MSMWSRDYKATYRPPGQGDGGWNGYTLFWFLVAACLAVCWLSGCKWPTSLRLTDTAEPAKQDLTMLSRPIQECPPCARFMQHYLTDAGGLRTEILRGYALKKVVLEDGQWSDPDVAQEYERRYGPITEVPIFWIRPNRRMVGYRGPQELVRFFRQGGKCDSLSL